MRWNGAELKTVEAWMPMLAAHKPGDVVDVVVLRDGEELPLKVTLKARSEEPR
jgi:S1-C subfamily serine protease